MTEEKAREVAEKIINCGHKDSFYCWKTCNDCENAYEYRELTELARFVLKKLTKEK